MTGDVLLPRHRHQLEVESAIPPSILEEEDIRSEPDSLGLPTPDPALRHPNSHKGQHFGQWGEVDDRGRPIDLGPGIWLGTRDVRGRLSGQYRPDRPRTAQNGHVVKYEGCRGTRPSPAVPRRCLEPLLRSKCDVHVTEGYKKALALAGAGACAISLAGVDAWRVKPQPNGPSEPVEDFDAVPWHGRVVWLTYDSDAAIKDGVRYAERRIAKDLESRRAVVIPLRIPQGADGSKRGIDDYFRDRLAAGVSREDALCELKACALAELARRRSLEQMPATGTDGAETCRACPGKDAEIAALTEQGAEQRAELRLLRSEAVPPGEAMGLAQLATVAASAQSRGETVENIYVPDVAKRAGVGAGTMTRTLNQVRRWQANPALADALPFTVEDYHAGGKDHVRLLVPRRDEDDRPSRPRRAMLQALERLPRDEGRGKHGGARDACPKCDSPMIRTTQDRCTNDACNHVVVHPSKIIGRPRHQDDSGRVGDVVELHGTAFVTEVQADEPGDRHQDDSVDIDVLRHQDGAGPLAPISFVDTEDREAAHAKPWRPRRVAAPPAPPPPRPAELPVAPESDQCWWSRPEHRTLHAAGSGA